MTDIRKLSQPVQNLSSADERTVSAEMRTAPLASALSSPQQQSLQTLATQLVKSPQTCAIAIFTGPDNAAKAAAAQALANSLHRQLRHIDLGALANQYGSNTGSALAPLLSSNTTGAILFFDEADALFNKRSDIQDSHNKYGSDADGILQLLEQYAGIIILSVSATTGWNPALLAKAHTTLKFPPDS